MKNFVTCSDCNTKWDVWCPVCKDKTDIHVAPNKEHTRKKPSKISKKPKPEQPTPITIYNFFIATKGVFKEVKSIPSEFHFFFKSKGSEYFTNKDKTLLIRKSDHWGSGIKYCDWYLSGYPKNHCGHWRTLTMTEPVKIGMIGFYELDTFKTKKKYKEFIPSKFDLNKKSQAQLGKEHLESLLKRVGLQY